MNKKQSYKIIMPFGKYKGKTIEHIMSMDIFYANWLIGIETKGLLRSALNVLHNDIKEMYETKLRHMRHHYSYVPDYDSCSNDLCFWGDCLLGEGDLC